MSISADYFVILAFVGLMVTSGTFWIGAQRGLLPWLNRYDDEPAPTLKPWSLLDLAMMLMFVIGSIGVAQAWALQGIDHGGPIQLVNLDPTTRVRMVWATSIGTLVGMICALTFIKSRHKLTLRELIGDWRYWRRDLARGVTLFLLVTPPVLALQMGLTQLFPSHHPLIQIVLKDPEPRFLWASGVSAVLCAPLVEEFQFRVLLQGWLQLVASKRVPVERWLIGVSYAPNFKEADLRTTPAPTSWWPVVGSSLFFAAVHWNHGPDLFFFALGLGWLYRRTGRALPSIIVHFLLNLWTLGLLLLKVYGSNG